MNRYWKPKESALGKIWSFINPRIWNGSDGVSYQVNSDGIATNVAPLMGDLPLSESGIKNIIQAESRIWEVGAYNELRGVEAGLDAHHVGQSALMKKLVPDFDHNTGPTILVPAVGHRFKGPNGIVSRSTKGFENARQVLARDIFELRRVYGDQKLPNSALQELIQINKTKFPEAYKRIIKE